MTAVRIKIPRRVNGSAGESGRCIMLRLKANKTSLYKLVNYYVSLPRMRQTQFTKAYRSPDYWLTWTDGWGRCGKAFLSACGGKPLLSITKSELWGEEVSREVHTLELADLRERAWWRNLSGRLPAAIA